MICSVLTFTISSLLIFHIMRYGKEVDSFNLTIVMVSCLFWILSIYSVLTLLFGEGLSPIIGWICVVFSVGFFLTPIFVGFFIVILYIFLFVAALIVSAYRV